MPLQSLVDYFNDRLGREHGSSFRPFSLEDGKVSGMFGHLRIDSFFTPIRQTLKPTSIVGHIAQITVAPGKPQQLCASQIENLLANRAPAAEFESIINFDRLCRTVHMLNYLTLAHLQGVLFLDVDPRHILGIKQDHGAYFEEVIIQCGLQTKNVVITLTANSQYARFYRELMVGLDNYRRRGYQIALKLEYFAPGSATDDLISQIAPDYLTLSARHLEHREQDDNALQLLQQHVAKLGGKTLLQQIDEKKADVFARTAGVDWVEGGYYRAIAFDYLRPENTAKQQAMMGG